MVKAAKTLVLTTRRYPQAYCEWLNKPKVDKTFNNFRTKFNREYQIQSEMAQKNAQQHGYSANVTEEGTLEGAVANFV